MGGEFQGFGDGVDHPTKHTLAICPMGVALLHFFDRCGGFSGARIAGPERAEDGVDGVEGIPEEVDLCTLGLGSKEKIVDVDIDAGKGLGPHRGVESGGGCGPGGERERA